jgi:hypothetical protein
MTILYFFLFLWVIFALLDPDPDPATQLRAPTPHSARRACLCTPLFLGGGDRLAGRGGGGGGSIFWKTRDIGFPSYSNNLSTMCCRCGELNDRADAARKKIEEDLSQALIRSSASSYFLLFRFFTNVSDMHTA